MGSLHLFEAVRQMKHPPVVVSACSSAEYGHVQQSRPFRLPKSSRFGLCIRMASARYAWICWRGNIFWITRFRRSIYDFSTPPDRARQMMRLQISCVKLIRIKKGLQPPVMEVGNLKPCRAIP